MGVKQVVEKQYGIMHNRGYIDALKGKLRAVTACCPDLTLKQAFTRQTFHDNEASHLPHPIRALCLGLGTLSDPDYNPTRSASQLTAFQAFLEVLSIPPEDVKMHDPNFSEEDKAYLTSLGYGLPKDAEEAKQDLICTVPTLVFAPYLPYPVFELLFERNWSQERLCNIVIIGTALEGWLDDEWVEECRLAVLFADMPVHRASNWFRGESKAFVPRIRKSSKPNWTHSAWLTGLLC